MTLTVKVKTGNAAMLTTADVAEALREVADRLHKGEGPIRDVNGNTVGSWSFK